MQREPSTCQGAVLCAGAEARATSFTHCSLEVFQWSARGERIWRSEDVQFIRAKDEDPQTGILHHPLAQGAQQST